MRRLREPIPKPFSLRQQGRVIGLGLLVFGVLLLGGGPTAEAHIETPNSMTLDIINHLERDVGPGETFRDWSFLTPEQNPNNPYCERQIERITLNDRDGKRRAAFKFKVVGNADARAHNFEAGAFVDSTYNGCRDGTDGAWLADGRVNLNAPIFRNPTGTALIQRPVNVRVGVDGTDEAERSAALRYEFGEVGLYNGLDLDEKQSAGIKRTSEGGAFGTIGNGAGYMVNDQTIWCAGLGGIANIQDYVRFLNSRGFTITSRVQWSGLFRNNCYQNFMFRQGNNDDGGIGNYDTRFGAFTAGAMGNQGAGWRNWFHNIGSEIPGLSRTGGAVNDFNLKASGLNNHDGAGTFNSNPLAGVECTPPGLNVDGCAMFLTPTPYAIPFVEAWFTMEWDPAGPAEPSPQLTCRIVLNPLNPEPNQSFRATMEYTYNGPANTVQYLSEIVGIDDDNNIQERNFADTNGVTIDGTFDLGVHEGSAGNYDYIAWIQIRNRPNTRYSCPGNVVIAAKPFFKVWTNDVKVGGGFKQADGSCTIANNEATIIGYGGDGNTDVFRGSSAEFGVFARGEIRNFFSAGRRSPRPDTATAQPTPPHGLTFANAQIDGITTSDPSDPRKVVNYGGMSGMDGCTDDWLSKIPEGVTPTTEASVGVTDARNVIHNTRAGTLFIDGGSYSGRKAIFATRASDVVIRGNIDGGDDRNNTLYIITSGNIKITANTRLIDAVLITTDTLFTCTKSGGGAWSPTELFASCGGQSDSGKLLIRGAVIANAVKLQRTFGTRTDSDENEGAIFNGAAEEIIFDPSLYITAPALLIPPREKTQIDFITSLPPIL